MSYEQHAIKDFDLDSPDAYSDEIHDDLEGRKEYRRSMCGKWFGKFKPRVGEHKFYISRCKQWRECPYCMEHKLHEEKEHFKKLVVSGQWNIIVVKKEEERELSSQLNDYERIPKGQDETVFLLKKEEGIGRSTTWNDIDELTTIACSIPTNRRRSEKSSTPIIVKEEDEQDETEKLMLEPTTSITVHDIVLDFDKADKDGPLDGHSLKQMVQDEFPLEFHPSTGEQLQYCVMVYNEVMKRLCEKYNIKFSVYRVVTKEVADSEINWQWLKKKLKLPLE